MPSETAPVIVSYRRLGQTVGRVLETRTDAIIEAVRTPDAGGFESAESAPVTDEQAARLVDELGQALRYLQSQEEVAGVLVCPEDRVTSLLQSFLAESSLEAGKVAPASAGGLEAQFDEHDVLGWAGSLLTWIRRLNSYPWQAAPASPDPVPDTLRVAVLGDWGSGLYGAPVCAASIQHDRRGYGLLLHLGDVYYSGTEGEVTDRFLNLWPRTPGGISRACNSNHEMYTGGHAYFTLTLRTFGQRASHFALQNAHWLLVGLDSAYEEGALAYGQVDWLNRLVESAGDRRVILFTHHQLFSWASPTRWALESQLGSLLEGKKLFAWYWGHEHRCVLYDPHPLWGIHGRCVGHSGYPYFRDTFTEGVVVERGAQETAWRRVGPKDEVPGGLILEGPNLYVPGHTDRYGPHGYMTLELDGPRLNEIVHTPDGSMAYERELLDREP